jgi:hypothetical protein
MSWELLTSARPREYSLGYMYVDRLARQQCGEIILPFRGVMSGDIPFPRVAVNVMLLPPASWASLADAFLAGIRYAPELCPASL